MNRPNILFALSSISLFLLGLVKYYVTSPIYKLLIELLLLSIAIFLTLMIIIELVLAIKNRFQRKRNLLLLVVMVITSFSIFYIIFRINVKVPLRGKVVLVA